MNMLLDLLKTLRLSKSFLNHLSEKGGKYLCMVTRSKARRNTAALIINRMQAKTHSAMYQIGKD
jgi:hypothetical protein